MTVGANKPATYDDLRALPSNVVGEIVDGELFVSPRPASPHAHAASIIGMDIGSAFQRARGGPGGWWIVYEPELHLARHVLVPDLAGWRVARMPTPPVDAPFYTLPPDWVCEVVSPASAAVDRVRKLPIYARHEVSFAWIVDPRERTLESYRRQGDRWLQVATFTGDEPVHVEPFEDIAFDIAALWIASPPVATP